MKFQAQGTGRLGKDATFTAFENGSNVIEFSVAENEFYKDKEGETQKLTHWHNIKIWGKGAEANDKLMARLVKGAAVAVRGDLRYNDSEKDGVKRTFTYIKVRMGDLTIFNTSSLDTDPNVEAPETPATDAPVVVDSADATDDLPF